ncbi:MAG: vWA domain-containing protein [Gammaproteobacteria bacterium]
MTVTGFDVAYPWVLMLLPLMVLPFFLHGHTRLTYSSLGMIPRDRVSDLLAWALRLVGAVAFGSLVVALSGPFRPAYVEPKVGQGAQMVVLLDRSRSMDQPFVGKKTLDLSMATPILPSMTSAAVPSKGAVARRLLSEFVASRKNDMFAMLVFSTYPLRVLPLTHKQEIVQAAIAAGNIGRGLAETDAGEALEAALESFESRPYTGSRIVLLVSDGAAELSIPAEERIKSLMQRHRAGLYWIYLRTKNAPDIFGEQAGSEEAGVAPQRKLHLFFSRMGTPYRAYKAENPEDLQRAIADVGRLQNLPMHYGDLIPRRDIAQLFFGASLVALLLLALSRALEVRVWR